MDDDKIVYNQAMQRIDDLIEEVFQLCEDVAEENYYEKTWVLERFREKFNKRKRDELT